jgi:hypothetical protein
MICGTDTKAELCGGTTEPDWKEMCLKPELVPFEVIIETSVPSLCSVDFKKVSKDTAMSTGGKIKTNMCEKYPNKCVEGGSEYDACAADWTQCLLNIDFHMCVHFDATCYGAEEMFGPQTTEITSWAELTTAVCAEDKDLYCRGTTDTINVIDVCAEIDTIPYEVVGGTGLGSLCYNADFEYICDELNLCETDLPNNLCARNGADNTDERCADGADATVKACVEDWQTCIIDPTFDFCAIFDDLCFPPAIEYKVEDIAPIDASQKMDNYGSAFFEKPNVGGSTSFPYTDTLKIVTCDFELIEPMLIADKIIASAISGKRALPLFPGSEFRPAI